MPKRHLVLLAAGAVGLLAACGGDSDRDEAATGPGGGTTVVLRDLAFKPARITVETGDTVTWRFRDQGIAHNVVADDGSFKSPTKDAGVFRHRFRRAGSFPYTCTLHPGMKGTVQVR